MKANLNLIGGISRSISRISVVGIALFLFVQGHAQPLTRAWTPQIHTPPATNGEVPVTGATVVATDAEGYIYAAGIYDFVQGNALPKVVILKYGFLGNVAGSWTVNIDNFPSLMERPSDIATDGCGNVFVCGSRYVYDHDDNGTFVPAHSEAYLIRINSTGNVALPFRAPSGASARMAIDQKGNVFVATQSETTSGFMLRQYDIDLAFRWQRALPATGTNLALGALAVDVNGNAYVGARYQSGSSPITDVIKVDRAGNISKSWSDVGQGVGVRRFSLSAIEIDADPKGSIFVAGSTNVFNSAFVVSKMDVAGHQLWTTAPVTGTATDLFVGVAGETYVAGAVGYPRDYRIVKFDTDGQLVWGIGFDGDVHGNDTAWGVGADPFGSVYVTGESTTSGFVNGTQRQHIVTLKLDGGNGAELSRDVYDAPAGYGAYSRGIAVDNGRNITVVGGIENYLDQGSMLVMMLSQTPISPPQNFATDAPFTTANQNMWGTGSSGFDRTYDLINKTWNVGGSYGGFWEIGFTIRLPFGIRIHISLGEFGGRVTARTNGEVGLRGHVFASVGGVNVNYPTHVAFATPGRESPEMRPGQEFQFISAFAVDAAAAMATTSPIVGAELRAYFRANAYVNAIAKAFSFTVFNWTPIPWEANPFFFDFERRLLYTSDELVGRLYKSFSTDYLYGYVKFPQIATNGSISQDAQGYKINSSGRDTFLSVNTDVTNLISSAFGVPTSFHRDLSIGSASVGLTASILQLRAGMNFDVVQNFGLRPGVPRVRLQLADGSFLNVRLPNGSISTEFPAGTNVTVTMPPGASITVTPIIDMPNAAFTNQTNLAARPQIGFDTLRLGLTANAFGRSLINVGTCLGCFIRQLADWQVNVYNSTFSLQGFNQFRAEPITIVGNSVLPELAGINKPCTTLYLYDQERVHQPVYYDSVRQKFQEFVAGETAMLVFGKGFDSGTKFYICHQGRKRQLTTVLLNSKTVRVSIPNRFFVLPGTARLVGEEPFLGETNTFDFPIEFPQPNPSTVGPSFWASDPDVGSAEVYIAVLDGKNAKGWDTFIARRDYYYQLARLWHDSFLHSIDPDEHEIATYFPGFDFSGLPQLPTILWNGQSLLTYGEPVPSGPLWALMPKDYIAAAQHATVQLVAPGPGGGISVELEATVSSPKPVLTGIFPSEIVPGSEDTKVTVKGPDHVDPVGNNRKRSNFNADSKIYWDGVIRPTTFVSSSELVTEIPAADLASPGNHQITVVSPSNGTTYFDNSTGTYVASGGTSNALTLLVRYPLPQIDQLSPSYLIVGSLDPKENGTPEPSYNLSLVGTGFEPDAKVQVNGTQLVTNFLSDKGLEAILPATYAQSPGNLTITVQNPSRGVSPGVTLPVLAKPIIRGHVSLPSFAGDPRDAKVSLQLVKVNDNVPTLVDEIAVPLDAAGNFQVSTVNSGTLRLAVKGSHWLAKLVGEFAFDGGSTTTVEAPLGLNGDIDDDNEITLADYSRLAASFGLAFGDPGFDAEADLDGDLEVTLADYAILAGGVGQAGDSWLYQRE